MSIRNYRHIGTNGISYISGLGSGKSQGGGGSTICSPIKDSIKLTFIPLLKAKEVK